jgi:hypothetical protein
MDKKPQHHCSKGHTIPIRGYCDLMNCRDYTPSAGNVCEYLDIEPSPDPRDGNEAQELVNEAVEPSPKDKEYPAKCTLFGGDKGKCRTECKKCWKDTRPESMPQLREKTLLEHFTQEIAFGVGEDYSSKQIAKNLLSVVSQWLPLHDQQVRKDLIEKVCKLLDDELRIISPNTEAKLKAHLRAMAGGVSDGT